jgi:hypothetical protein
MHFAAQRAGEHDLDTIGTRGYNSVTIPVQFGYTFYRAMGRRAVIEVRPPYTTAPSVWWSLARSVMLFAGAEEQKPRLRCSAVQRRLGGCLEAAGEARHCKPQKGSWCGQCNGGRPGIMSIVVFALSTPWQARAAHCRRLPPARADLAALRYRSLRCAAQPPLHCATRFSSRTCRAL